MVKEKVEEVFNHVVTYIEEGKGQEEDPLKFPINVNDVAKLKDEMSSIMSEVAKMRHEMRSLLMKTYDALKVIMLCYCVYRSSCSGGDV